jgi:hypothetical protein
MLIDTKIIRQRGRYAILAQSHEVPLRDNSITKLHLVIEGRNTEPARLLRAFMLPEAGTFIVDMGDLATQLQKELRECVRRDAPGVVNHFLRMHYPTATALRAAIVEQAIASFRPDDDEQPELAALTSMAAAKSVATGALA